jgi:GNAT superfamily N-acetyltransferase
VTVVKLLSAEEALAHSAALAAVLLDCVAGGASVSFMADLTAADAQAFFTRAASEAAAGKRAIFAAFDGERIDGTAQLLLDTPPNQPHRAELAKMLVHRRARGRGLGRLLFAAAEAEARQRGRTLLTFDTVTGAAGERLYLACGCIKVGEIPGYALFPNGTPAGTSVFYKVIKSTQPT